MTVAAARLVEVEPDAWDGLLERDGFRDVYFSRDYVEAAASVEPGAAVFLHLDGVIFPVVVREHEGVADATSPTGYGGPLALREDAPVDAFYDLYERWCQSNGIVTTFVRFHPLLANHRYSPFRVEPVAGSVSWRLEGDLFAGMHAHHRRAVRKAERAGVEVDVREAPAGLDAFVALYEETMRRLGASPFYFFGAEYWRLLAKRLRDRIVLLEARLGNEVVASILCFAARPWLHYHLGATAEAGRGAGASHLLMLAAARWAQEGGFEQFHLGAGIGGGGGPLLEWKRRFYPHELLEQWVGKAVHHRERYLALTGGDTVSFDGFFPAYRQP